MEFGAGKMIPLSIFTRAFMIQLLLFIYIYSVNSVNSSEIIDITNNNYEKLACDGITNDTPKLQKLIDKPSDGGGLVFNIPRGRICVFSGRIFMRSNIAFHFQDNAAFAGGSWVYVSRTKDSGDGPHDIVWLNCKFISTEKYVTRTHILIRASNVTFKGCIWDRVFRRDTHVIDIGGSDNILIDQNIFIGSMPGLDQAKNISKEAIQADYAWKIGMTVSEEDLTKAGSGLIVYDNRPSRNITVINSRFIPSYKPDGTVESFPPPPFGVHATTPECLANLSMCMGNVRFINNYVLNIVDMGNLRTNFGILHWRLQNSIVIEGNTFESTGYQNDYIFSIQIPKYSINDIKLNIKRNRFIGIYPRKALTLIKEENSINKLSDIKGNISICENEFYVTDGNFRTRILESPERSARNIALDCGNRFKAIREAPSTRLR